MSLLNILQHCLWLTWILCTIIGSSAIEGPKVFVDGDGSDADPVQLTGYVQRYGDCTGFDLAFAYQGIAEQECRKYCDRTDCCVGFHYKEKKVSECYLKSRSCNKTSYSDYRVFSMYDKVGQTNYAFKKPAEHSNNRGSVANAARRAVDGKRNGTDAMKTCSYVAFDGDVQWWRVDLEENIHVSRIIIASRTDSCCLKRLEKFNVFVTDVAYLPASNDTRYLCQSYTGVFPDGVWYIKCERPVIGRYVTIASTGVGLLEFVLCEVEVYGMREKDLNTEKPAIDTIPSVILDDSRSTCGTFSKNNPIKVNLAGIRPRARHRAPMAVVAYIDRQSTCSYALESDLNIFFPVGGRTPDSCRYWQRCEYLNHYLEGPLKRCEFICEHTDNRKTPIKELLLYSNGVLCELNLGTC